MAKPPRKDYCGFKHEVIPASSGASWFVSGPTLKEDAIILNKDDAETLAAALNFASNFETMKKRADQMRNELEYFMEFK